jgi:hypothetical protein
VGSASLIRNVIRRFTLLSEFGKIPAATTTRCAWPQRVLMLSRVVVSYGVLASSWFLAFPLGLVALSAGNGIVAYYLWKWPQMSIFLFGFTDNETGGHYYFPDEQVVLLAIGWLVLAVGFAKGMRSQPLKYVALAALPASLLFTVCALWVAEIHFNITFQYDFI